MQLTIQDGGYKNRRRGGNSAMSILPWGGGGDRIRVGLGLGLGVGLGVGLGLGLGLG